MGLIALLVIWLCSMAKEQFQTPKIAQAILLFLLIPILTASLVREGVWSHYVDESCGGEKL